MFVFEHSPLAQASALDRKKKRDELALAQQAYLSLCPQDLMACAVPGIDGAYEVSHSSSLLTSSGLINSVSTHRRSWNRVEDACMVSCIIMGRWTILVPDPSRSAALKVGVLLIDSCSAGGALMGAATCTSGRCEYTACQRGYELLEGYCVPVLGGR